MVTPRKVARRGYGSRPDERRDRRHARAGGTGSGGGGGGGGSSAIKINTGVRSRVGVDWTPTGLGAFGARRSGGGGRTKANGGSFDFDDSSSSNDDEMVVSVVEGSPKKSAATARRKGAKSTNGSGGDKKKADTRRSASASEKTKKSVGRAWELHLSSSSDDDSDAEEGSDEDFVASQDVGGKKNPCESRATPRRTSPRKSSAARKGAASFAEGSSDEDSGTDGDEVQVVVVSGKKAVGGGSKRAGKTTTTPRGKSAGKANSSPKQHFLSATRKASRSAMSYSSDDDGGGGGGVRSSETKRRAPATKAATSGNGGDGGGANARKQQHQPRRRRRAKSVIPTRLPPAPRSDDVDVRDLYGGGGKEEKDRSTRKRIAPAGALEDKRKEPDDVEEFTETPRDEVVEFDDSSSDDGDEIDGDHGEKDVVGQVGNGAKTADKRPFASNDATTKSGRSSVPAPNTTPRKRRRRIDPSASPTSELGVGDDEGNDGGKGTELEHPIGRAKAVDLTEDERELDDDDSDDSSKGGGEMDGRQGEGGGNDSDEDRGDDRDEGGCGKDEAEAPVERDGTSEEESEDESEGDDDSSYGSEEEAPPASMKVDGPSEKGEIAPNANGAVRSTKPGAGRSAVGSGSKREDDPTRRPKEKQAAVGEGERRKSNSGGDKPNGTTEAAPEKVNSAGRTKKARQPPCDSVSRQIYDILIELSKVCKDFLQLSQEDTDCLSLKTEFVQKMAELFRSLSALRSSVEMGAPAGKGGGESFSKRFEEAAEAVGKRWTAKFIGACLYMVVNSASGDPEDAAVSRRLPFLRDCLRLFVGAETAPGALHALSAGAMDGLPPTMKAALYDDLPAALLQFATEPSSSGPLVATCGRFGRRARGPDLADLENRESAALLAAACLHAVDPNSLLPASGIVRKTLVDAAARIHLLPSYPLLELTLLFLVRLRRAALASSHGSTSQDKGLVRIVDSALFSPVRERLARLSSVLLSGESRRGGVRLAGFPDWVRECFVAAQEKSETLGVASFRCNGVYRPTVSGDIGARIAEIPWIDVCDTGVSFFACTHVRSAPNAEDDLLDKLSPEVVYAGRIVVHVRFSDMKKSRNEDANLGKCCVSFSMEDASVTLDISQRGWSSSNLPCLAPDIKNTGRPSLGSVASAGSNKAIDLQGEDVTADSQKTALKIFVKRDAFQDFLEALRARHVVLFPTDDESIKTSPGRSRVTHNAAEHFQDTDAHSHIELCTKEVPDKLLGALNHDQTAGKPCPAGSALKSGANKPDKTSEKQLPRDPSAERQAVASAVSAEESESDGSDDEAGSGKRKRKEDQKPSSPLQSEAQPSPANPQKRTRVHTAGTNRGSVAEVTPVASSRGKGARLEENPNSRGFCHVNAPKERVDGIARPHGGLLDLQSLSALCFATTPNDSPLALPSSVATASGAVKADDIAQLIASTDNALANAADAMNTLGSLAERIMANKNRVSSDLVNSVSWVHNVQEEVRAQNKSWSSRRADMDEKLREHVISTLVTRK